MHLKIFQKIFFFCLFLTLTFGAVSVYALGNAQIEAGLNRTADTAGLNQYESSITDIIGKGLGSLLSVVSVMFFILMLYAGVRWMIARGNEDSATKAKNTIIAAIIGMIIIFAAYAITNFVFNAAGKGQAVAPGVSSPGAAVVAPEQGSAAEPVSVANCIEVAKCEETDEGPCLSYRGCEVLDDLHCTTKPEFQSLNCRVLNEADCIRFQESSGLCEWIAD